MKEDSRDVFTLAAAWLNTGVPPSCFTTVVHDPIPSSVAISELHDESLIWRIVSVDVFGNLIYNITAKQVREFRAVMGRSEVEFHIGPCMVNELVGTSSIGSRQSPSPLINGSGNLEIFFQQESATQHLRIGIGEEIRLC